jgi:hypothetical protein
VTEPYNDTLQFYQVGLYLLWIFTAVALMAVARRHAVAGAAAILIGIALSLPSSLHYLTRKWTDRDRPALVSVSSTEVDIAAYLRGLDPQTTVVLHDRPRDPSLLAVLSARRSVLAWGRYAVGSGERMRRWTPFRRHANAGTYARYPAQTPRHARRRRSSARPRQARMLALLRPVLTGERHPLRSAGNALKTMAADRSAHQIHRCYPAGHRR